MLKEITSRIIKVILAVTVGILVFPYVGDIMGEYFDRIGFFWEIILFLGLGITFFALYLFLRTIPFFRKEMEHSNLTGKSIAHLLDITVLTAFAIVGLGVISPFWVCITLVAFQTIDFIQEIMEKREELT